MQYSSAELNVPPPPYSEHKNDNQYTSNDEGQNQTTSPNEFSCTVPTVQTSQCTKKCKLSSCLSAFLFALALTLFGFQMIMKQQRKTNKDYDDSDAKTIPSTYQKLKSELEGKCANGKGRDHKFEVCLFNNIIQKNIRNPYLKYKVGFFSDHDHNWNEETKTLTMTDSGVCKNGKRRGEIKFICSHNRYEQNTISQVSEFSACVYKMDWFTELVCSYQDTK